MNKYFAKLFFLIFLGISSNASSQSYVDLLNLNYKISPNNQYVGADGEVDVENISGNVRLPIQLKNNDVILAGFTVNQLNFISTITDDVRPSSYYSTRLEIGYQKRWGDSLDLLIMALPRISSDFVELDERSNQFGGAAILTKVKNENFKWKFGLYLNTDFFGIFTTPLVGFDWKMSNKIRAFGMLPASMTLAYDVSKRYKNGLIFIASSTSYRVTESNTDDYIHQLTNQLSFFNDVYITKSIVFRGQVGFSAFRFYRLYQNDDRNDITVSGIGFGGDRSPVFEGAFNDFGDGIVLQAGLIYRYNLEK